jgi:hypothetical protein
VEVRQLRQVRRLRLPLRLEVPILLWLHQQDLWPLLMALVAVKQAIALVTLQPQLMLWP